jgi:hypothetical protein
MDPALSGSHLSISLKDVTLEEGMRLILQQANAKYVIRNGTIHVSPQ